MKLALSLHVHHKAFHVCGSNVVFHEICLQTKMGSINIDTRNTNKELKILKSRSKRYLSSKRLLQAFMGVPPDLGVATDDECVFQDRCQGLANHLNEFVMGKALIGPAHVHLECTGTGTDKSKHKTVPK